MDERTSTAPRQVVLSQLTLAYGASCLLDSAAARRCFLYPGNDPTLLSAYFYCRLQIRAHADLMSYQYNISSVPC